MGGLKDLSWRRVHCRPTVPCWLPFQLRLDFDSAVTAQAGYGEGAPSFRCFSFVAPSRPAHLERTLSTTFVEAVGEVLSSSCPVVNAFPTPSMLGFCRGVLDRLLFRKEDARIRRALRFFFPVVDPVHTKIRLRVRKGLRFAGHQRATRFFFMR